MLFRSEDGTYTVTCGEVSVTVKDGEKGDPGEKGETGETGDAGANGHNSMIVIEKIEPGDADCPNGGQLVTVGIDIDDSGTLDEGEGNVSQKVCNGLDGEDGENGVNGYNSLVEVTPDTETCPAGGYNIKTGIDTNGNLVLDTDPNEVVTSVFVCNGIDGKDGTDGVCAGNNAPVIEKIEINGEEFTGSPIVVDLMPVPVVITATDADGDSLSVAVSGAAIVEEDGWDGDKNTLKLTLTKTGANTFSVIVSDGCQIIVKTFTVMSYELRSTKQWGTSGFDNGFSVAVDSSGNIFVTGFTAGGLDGNTYLLGIDIFLTKFDNNGNKLWTKQWGTNKDEQGYSVAVDSSDNVFVTGYTAGDLDGNTFTGWVDIFLTKFDNDGNKLWTRQWGTVGRNTGNSVAVDSLDNVFVVGTTQGDLDGNTNIGEEDIFLTKFDNDGNKLWTKQWGTIAPDIGNSVAIDSSDNVLVTGWTAGELDGNTFVGNEDIFLTKFDNDGNKLWTKQWGTTQLDEGNSVAVDSSDNVFVTGYTYGNLDGNASAGGLDILLTKFDNDGNKLWTKQWGTNKGDGGNSVSVDSSDNVLVTGWTVGELDGNTNIGKDDIFVSKFNNDGNKLWTKQWGTVSEERGSSILIDGWDNVFLTGLTVGDLDGNTNAGSLDIFLTKWIF